MSIETNKKLIQRSVDDYYNAKDIGVIDELFTPDYKHHFPGNDMDREAFKAFSLATFKAFPDLELTADLLIGEGDTVVKMWSVKCTHQDEFMGIPATGNKVNITGFSRYKIRDGKLAECWELMDTFTMMQQLGVIPVPASA